MEILDAIISKLEEMKDEPIDYHNEYTEEYSIYKRRFAQKMLLFIKYQKEVI